MPPSDLKRPTAVRPGAFPYGGARRTAPHAPGPRAARLRGAGKVRHPAPKRGVPVGRAVAEGGRTGYEETFLQVRPAPAVLDAVADEVVVADVRAVTDAAAGADAVMRRLRARPMSSSRSSSVRPPHTP